MTYPTTEPNGYRNWRDDCRDNDELYALVGPDGIIVFEKYPDNTMARLPLVSGPAEKVVKVVKRFASLHHDNVTYYLPTVARARSMSDGVGELARLNGVFTKAMENL